MSKIHQRSTKRWATTALVAGSMSALLAAPLSMGTATASASHHNRHVVTEKPTMLVNSIRPGVVALHAHTNPALERATVYFYQVVRGEKKIVGYAVTGPAGRAMLRVHMQPGTIHRFVAKAVHLNRERARFSNSSPVVKHYRSKYSNVVRHRIPS